jgi:hypothetical protein
LAPDFAEGHDNLGNVFREQGMLDEAIASHRRSLELKPSVARTHNHLGNAFRDAGMTEEAEACYRRALELNPDFPHALYNLGNTVRELGKITEAISLYRRALQLSPSFAEAEFNLASALLLLGSYEEGWARYESRRALFPPGTPSSLFGRGTPTDGQTILLQCEQGFGDTLQFLRYAVWMSARMPMARITLESPPELARLLDQSVRGRIEVIPRQIGVESETPKADRSLPLLSLPWALRMIEPLPMSAPYLHVDPAIKTKWRDRLRPTPKLRVGLAWKGRQGPKVKRARSLPCEKLLGLFESPSVELYSLQMGADPSEQAALAASGVIDLAPQIRDFADTAAIVAELDLILSIDTALAHLAGALGRPVWTFLKYVPDWRWGMQGESTAWYPTMRLFRQSARDDWDSVLDRIRVELAFAKSAGIARTTDSSPAFVQA